MVYILIYDEGNTRIGVAVQGCTKPKSQLQVADT